MLRVSYGKLPSTNRLEHQIITFLLYTIRENSILSIGHHEKRHHFNPENVY